jgi:hypothetical protein
MKKSKKVAAKTARLNDLRAVLKAAMRVDRIIHNAGDDLDRILVFLEIEIRKEGGTI